MFPKRKAILFSTICRLEELGQAQAMEIETQEVNTIEVLKKLTENFRARLNTWKDSAGKTRKIVIDGVESELLHTNSQSVAKYAREYTEVWMKESEMMKR